jgi:DNA/RNA-binding domain of Phe-tRNA-synthetase-like protein
MITIEATERWYATFPGGHVGVLLIGNVDNTQPAPALDAHKRQLEAHLRHQFAGWSRTDLLELEVLQAYRRYYKQFDKTYHVQLQLESIVHKGKGLPNVSPLVDANFAAELETLVLTAGHDADLLVGPLMIDASQGNEAFVQLNGKLQPLKPNDMIMTDAQGVICTIIYGQDQRTPISAQTRRALYVAYAPVGVAAALVERQLERIRDLVQLVSASAMVELLTIWAAGEAGCNDQS